MVKLILLTSLVVAVALAESRMGDKGAEQAVAEADRELMNTVARYNWALCDQCSSNPNDLCHAAGIIKNRKMRRSCDWAPCDPNNEIVNERGWFCKSNTDAVLVPQGSKQTGRRVGRGDGLTILPSHPANRPQGFEIILPQQSVACVPCQGAKAGSWCKPGSSTGDGDLCGFSCKACNSIFPDNPYLAGRGWFCDDSSTDSPNVCVNAHNIAIIDMAKFMTEDAARNTTQIRIPRSSFAAAIEKKPCRDTPICLWGSIAAAVLLVVVSGGIGVAAFPDAFALTYEMSDFAVEYEGRDFISKMMLEGNGDDTLAAIDLFDNGWTVIDK